MGATQTICSSPVFYVIFYDIDLRTIPMRDSLNSDLYVIECSPKSRVQGLRQFSRQVMELYGDFSPKLH